MTSRLKTFSLLLFVLIAAMLAVPARDSLAHVDDDSMPDSVAEVEYRIFLEFNPRDITIINKLGMVLYRRNKLREAAREFTKALKIDPANFDALDAMGLVKTAQQEYDQAISYHQQAIAIKTDDVLVHYHLGIALEKKGLLREAAIAYRKALEIQAAQGATSHGDQRAAKHAETIRAALGSISGP
jgi:tetratricopeptide (TPR) repeat protein